MRVRAIGLCTQSAFPDQQDHPCIISHNNQVWDLNPAAIARKIAIGTQTKEAKTILQKDGYFQDYKPESFQKVQQEFVAPALLYASQIQLTLAGEFFIDLTPHPQPLDVAATLLHQIHLANPTLTLLSGIAPGIQLTILSSQTCNPDRLALNLLPIAPITNPSQWLAPKPIRILPHIDRLERIRLEQLGFYKISQVQKAPLKRLEEQFPKRSLAIHQASHGLIHDPVTPNYPHQAISQRILLSECTNQLEIHSALHSLAIQLAQKLNSKDQQATQAQILITLDNNQVLTCHKKFPKPILSTTQLYTVFQQLVNTLSISNPINAIEATLSELTTSPRKQTRLNIHQLPASDEILKSTVNRLDASLGTGTVKLANHIKCDYQKQVLQEWKRATGWN